MFEVAGLRFIIDEKTGKVDVEIVDGLRRLVVEQLDADELAEVAGEILQYASLRTGLNELRRLAEKVAVDLGKASKYLEKKADAYHKAARYVEKGLVSGAFPLPDADPVAAAVRSAIKDAADATSSWCSERHDGDGVVMECSNAKRIYQYLVKEAERLDTVAKLMLQLHHVLRSAANLAKELLAHRW